MKIAILHHTHTDLSRSRYLVRYLADLWKNQGHSVGNFKDFNPLLFEADVVFLHVDLTRIPEQYSQALAQHPVVINRHITDISKNLYSEIQVSANDNYTGPVIVKTLCNFGGLPESRMRNMSSAQEFSMDKLSITEPVSWSNIESLKEYFIVRSLDQVPPGVWHNPHLMVEKFLPEKTADGHFHIREWIFFGGSDMHYMNTSTEAIIKGRTTSRRTMLPVTEIPQKLRAIRARLKIDYGKFDYAIHNGETILYDINKTIGVPEKMPTDTDIQQAILHISRGINDFNKAPQ